MYCDVHVWGSPENIYATNTCVVARLVTGHGQRLGRMCQNKVVLTLRVRTAPA